MYKICNNNTSRTFHVTNTLFNSTKTFNVNNYVMHTVGAKRYFCTALVSSEAHCESQTLSSTNTDTYHTTGNIYR